MGDLAGWLGVVDVGMSSHCYTIGHTVNYRKAIEETGQIEKCGRDGCCNGDKGGYAFRTVEDAKQRIQEQGKQGEWSVWEMETEFDSNTYPNPDGGWWHHLINDAPITREILAGGE